MTETTLVDLAVKVLLIKSFLLGLSLGHLFLDLGADNR